MRKAAGVLLVLSGGATAVQVYWLVMWGIWGRPTSPLEGLAILGSVVQVVAGISLIAGARWLIPTAIGLLLTWLFYAPALVVTARAGLSQIRAEPSAVIPSLLLISASAAFLAFVLRRHEVARP